MKNKKPSVKNVALCFSGQARTLELCYPYIKKNLLDQIGSHDIFCFSEDDGDFKKVKLLNYKRLEKVKFSDVDEIIQPEIRLLNKQNYKTILFLESFRFNFRNIYQQLYKIRKSFDLLEEYMKKERVSYNYFIRLRFDFLPFDTIKLENFKLKENEIIVPKINDSYKNKINDMFCITKEFENFKSYCSLYDNFRKIVQKNASIKPTFFQKIFFFFEKNYVNFFLFINKKLNKKQKKLPRSFFGVFLLFPKMFYKKFKTEHMCLLERVLFYHLKNKKIKIREELINYVIVRNSTEGLLVFG
ncbi:MAG: hypothetical protein ABIH49_03225 [archaeon]